MADTTEYDRLSAEFALVNAQYNRVKDAAAGEETPELTAARSEFYRMREAVDAAYREVINQQIAENPENQEGTV